MLVAVARKLAIALWRFLEQGLVPQGAILANVTSKSCFRTRRQLWLFLSRNTRRSRAGLVPSDKHRNTELAPYSEADQTRVGIDGPQVLLAPSAAQAVAVTLHELATNASKYGALSAAEGRIELKWSHEPDGQLTLRWTETGGPTLQRPERKGFGSRLIEQTIGQLKGTAHFDRRPEGLVCEITLCWSQNELEGRTQRASIPLAALLAAGRRFSIAS
jgi:hypothetical protein